MMELAYLRNVTSLSLDSDACIGCGMCLQVCPHGVFVISKGKAFIENRDRCMECGACKRNCPVGALAVREGVGCAAAIITGSLKGTEPQCGCSGENDSGSCCG